MADETKRVALVTGGSVGLGRAIATELARCGWCLCLQHDHDAEVGEAVEAVEQAASDAGHSVDVEAFACDLSVAAQREQLVEEVVEAFDRIDLLVNAHASAPPTATDLLETSEEAYRSVLDAQLLGPLLLTQLVASEMVRMVEAGLIEGPRIVTINSISAEASSVDHGPHCVARAALAMMTRLFADRLGEHGIGVFEVRVGLISTSPMDPAYGRYNALIEQGLTPIRRWGHPGDVARAVSAVAEDLLGFSTGEVLHVDGGFHLRRL